MAEQILPCDTKCIYIPPKVYKYSYKINCSAVISCSDKISCSDISSFGGCNVICFK